MNEHNGPDMQNTQTAMALPVITPAARTELVDDVGNLIYMYLRQWIDDEDTDDDAFTKACRDTATRLVTKCLARVRPDIT